MTPNLKSRMHLGILCLIGLALVLPLVGCERDTKSPSGPEKSKSAADGAEKATPNAEKSTSDEEAGAAETTSEKAASPESGSPESTSAADDDDPVVLYCSVDEEFGREVIAAYEGWTGREVQVVFDTEAGKTTGLVRKIEAERDRPRADVFWSSELFNTILLGRQGLLAPYDSPSAADIPERYRDQNHLWTAFGVRGRVVAYNPQEVDEAAVPTTWAQLAEPSFASKVAVANPIFGTTRGHVAAMFALWGEDEGSAWLMKLSEGEALVSDSNSATVRAVLAGRVQFAATDTDDVYVANRSGATLEVAWLDMGDGGTLLIPNSVALLAGAPHPEAARKLIDYLVSAEVERRLAESTSGNIPVRESLRGELEMVWPPETSVSFDDIADAMEASSQAVREILLR
jgi:iron(III) transport system substrate-binding protein